MDGLISFFTSRCPICRFRYGHRTNRPVGLLARLCHIGEFECASCNLPYHALTLFSKAPPPPPGRRGY